MADDPPRIQFGSLEGTAAVDGGEAQLHAAELAGHINLKARDAGLEVLELSASSREARAQHAAGLREVEVAKAARTTVVPTAVEDVKRALRGLGEPVTLFGEKAGDRRMRLQRLVAADALEGGAAGLQALGGGAKAAPAPASELDPARRTETFYAPASKALQEAREAVAAASFAKARQRILGLKRRREEPAETDAACLGLYKELQNLGIRGSQVADTRPVSCCKMSPVGELAAAEPELAGSRVVTGSWTGQLKVWHAATLMPTVVCRGHADRVVACDWHPGAEFSARSSEDAAAYPSPRILASGAADGLVKLWDARRCAATAAGASARGLPKDDGETAMDLEDPAASKGRKASGPTEWVAPCLSTLAGHKARLANVAFHDTGRFLASSSFDQTWRLWDLETEKELLLQDGHLRPVYGLAFHPDGALVGTTDLSGVALLWDLRSGKQVHKCLGHVKRVLTVDFSPGGWQMATAGDDQTVKLWDIRGRRCLYTIPAHGNLVTKVRFTRPSGEALLSCSFDGKVKVWSTRDYACLRSLSGHEGRVLGGDAGGSERHFASVGYDRTLKIWARDALA